MIESERCRSRRLAAEEGMGNVRSRRDDESFAPIALESRIGSIVMPLFGRR